LIHRQQVIRAYDHHGRIADGTLADSSDHALAVIQHMLARLLQLHGAAHMRSVIYQARP